MSNLLQLLENYWLNYRPKDERSDIYFNYLSTNESQDD